MAQAPSIDFRLIRPHRGTQHAGFEELCVTLFRAEVGGPDNNVVRVEGSGGDGGVEAYLEVGARPTVGIQAKFFDKLGTAQWAQIKSSIHRACTSHPTLRRYYVASPLDRTPAEVRHWKALQATNKRKWPKVTLCWWGQSELVGLLTKESQTGRAAYWFGTPQFDAEWLSKRNEQALKDLDTRYSPDRHVRVPCEDVLAAFISAPSFVTEYYGHASQVWTALREATDQHLSTKLPRAVFSKTAALLAAMRQQLPRLGSGASLPNFQEVTRATNDLLEALRILNLTFEAWRAAPPHRSEAGTPSSNSIDRFEYKAHQYSKARDALYELADFVQRNEAIVDRRSLLVLGDAGSGKSHLLASVVRGAAERGQPALLLLGEYFTTADEPSEQLTSRLGWSQTLDELLAAMNVAGEIAQTPSLLVVDAINESSDRAVWQRRLSAFAGKVTGYSWVRLIVSCRTDFLPITVPPAIAEGRDAAWHTVRHTGFGSATFRAIHRYFDAYRVRAREMPLLLAEFENPLFLKTFCEAFEDSAIPPGPITFQAVMRRRVEVAAKAIARSIDCSPNVVMRGITEFADLIAKNHGVPVGETEARTLFESLFPEHRESRSLFRHLRSTGILAEVGHWDASSGGHEVRVRFAYERFSDYFIAERILGTARTLPNLRRQLTRNGYLKRWNSAEHYQESRGVLGMLALLLPSRMHVELTDLLTGRSQQEIARMDLLASLAWRDPRNISRRTKLHVATALKDLSAQARIELLMRLGSIPAHPWNADYLHDYLARLSLWRRELEWTIPISKWLASARTALPESLVGWLFEVRTGVLSAEQLRLVATLVFWLFSSNDRGFRNRSTLAAIRLLVGHSEIAAELVERFSVVNDPYVVERVFAVAAGVAIRESDQRKLGRLAEVVWRFVFQPRIVPVHVLQRDYAYTVMEAARDSGCLPAGVSKADYSPPYRSSWPPMWSKAQTRKFDTAKGWHQIASSIEPNVEGTMYGDFGRYTMQSRVSNWLATKRTHEYPRKTERRAFDPLVARAWILQRVAQNGWTPARFEQYDASVPGGRSRVDTEDTKQERIGKKFQWNALHELEALLADHFHFGTQWGDGPEVYEGAWQLSSRDFRPGRPLEDPLIKLEEVSCPPLRRTLTTSYPSPFRNRYLNGNPSAWVRTWPSDLRPLMQLSAVDSLEGDALVLNGWFSWNAPEPYPPRTREDGKCHQFVHFRSSLVPRSALAQHFGLLETTHLWGNGCGLPEFGSHDLGGYPGAAHFRELRAVCAGDDPDWPALKGSVQTVVTLDGGSVPSPQLLEILRLRWSGSDYDFVDDSGKVVAQALTVAGSDSKLCVVNRSLLHKALSRADLILAWIAVGERYCLRDGHSRESVADAMVSFSAAFFWDDSDMIQGDFTVREIVEMNPARTRIREGFPSRSTKR